MKNPKRLKDYEIKSYKDQLKPWEHIGYDRYYLNKLYKKVGQGRWFSKANIRYWVVRPKYLDQLSLKILWHEGMLGYQELKDHVRHSVAVSIEALGPFIDCSNCTDVFSQYMWAFAGLLNGYSRRKTTGLFPPRRLKSFEKISISQKLLENDIQYLMALLRTRSEYDKLALFEQDLKNHNIQLNPIFKLVA